RQSLCDRWGTGMRAESRGVLGCGGGEEAGALGGAAVAAAAAVQERADVAQLAGREPVAEAGSDHEEAIGGVVALEPRVGGGSGQVVVDPDGAAIRVLVQPVAHVERLPPA